MSVLAGPQPQPRRLPAGLTSPKPCSLQVSEQLWRESLLPGLSTFTLILSLRKRNLLEIQTRWQHSLPEVARCLLPHPPLAHSARWPENRAPSVCACPPHCPPCTAPSHLSVLAQTALFHSLPTQPNQFSSPPRFFSSIAFHISSEHWLQVTMIYLRVSLFNVCLSARL